MVFEICRNHQLSCNYFSQKRKSNFIGKIKKILPVIVHTFFFFSCSESGNYLPGYSGNIGEIVVVIDDVKWNSKAGEIIKNTLAQPQFGLPQDEPVFNLIQVSSKNFSKIFQTHRNILIADFAGNSSEVKTEVKSNSWARGQVAIKISAPDDSSFANFFEKYSENIIQKFNQAEIERQIEKNKKFGETKLSEKIKEKSGLSLILQKDCYLAKEDSNFLWFRLERGRGIGGYEHQISQGIFIYWQNYTDTNLFSPQKILAQNDSVSKKYISGSAHNSFFTTSYKLVEPQVRKIKINNKFGTEIRGLWRMENEFMGGPFISLTFLDDKKNLLITAEGYVFAPQFDKLNYLREVEAMIKSIELLRS